MQPYQIILLILIIAAFVGLLFFIFVFTHIYDFHRSMQRRLRAMDILLSQKSANLLQLVESLQNDGIAIDKGDLEYTKRLAELHFEKSTATTVSENKAKIEAVRKKLSYLSVANKDLSAHPSYKECVSNLEDLDKAFRRCVVLYNNDLSGFNYWINIPGIRPFVFLFRIEKAKPIN
ncbi:MAG: hypothetical protein II467_01575 [Bacilli bacterium]|nr:hypothetical protein [Bacilli bacterium]MBQ4255247.1 hypothetical protein [Bacilli bacterium]